MLLKFVLLFFLKVSSHEIFQLPGQNFTFDSRQFAGFLNLTNSRRMFYWLAESENNVTNDPLIFWFNGGPGCSSLSSLFFNGPLKIDSMGRELGKNQYSLTKLGSIVYIESPTPVGFSYSTNKSNPINDYETAKDNYEAIKLFLEEYPKFRNHEVFLTGISYAGTTVPMLAGNIIDNQEDFRIKLKGIAINAPFLNARLNLETRLEYSYAHGFLDEDIHQHLLEQCGDNKSLEDCSLVNHYTNSNHHREMDNYQIDKKCEKAVEKNDANPNSCSYQGDGRVEIYFNRKDTRETLRIPEEAGSWKRCRNFSFYSARLYEMDEYIKKAVENDVKVVLYYGDMDMVCPFLEGQQLVERLGIEEIGNGLITKKDQQIIGKYTSYENLDLLVFKNAGHTLGSNFPEINFELHQKFFNNQKFDVFK